MKKKKKEEEEEDLADWRVSGFIWYSRDAFLYH